MIDRCNHILLKSHQRMGAFTLKMTLNNQLAQDEHQCNLLTCACTQKQFYVLWSELTSNPLVHASTILWTVPVAACTKTVTQILKDRTSRCRRSFKTRDLQRIFLSLNTHIMRRPFSHFNQDELNWHAPENMSCFWWWWGVGKVWSFIFKLQKSL